MDNQLKNYRRKLFTQNELAEKLHVTRQTISKWENGQSEPDITSMIQLSNIFDIPFEQVASWFSIEEIKKVPRTLKNIVKKKYNLLFFICVGNTLGIVLLILLFLMINSK